MRDLTTSGDVQTELEKEWEQLIQDRVDAREVFPTGNSKVMRCTILFLLCVCVCACVYVCMYVNVCA